MNFLGWNGLPVADLDYNVPSKLEIVWISLSNPGWLSELCYLREISNAPSKEMGEGEESDKSNH